MNRATAERVCSDLNAEGHPSLVRYDPGDPRSYTVLIDDGTPGTEPVLIETPGDADDYIAGARQS